MSDREKGVELKVGVFVILGLLVLLGMIIHFGRLGEGFKSYYELRIEFPNASGLLKGSSVLYGGARIGRVSEEPRITNRPQRLEETAGVVITLKIEDNIHLPKESSFVVGSSGLLGDRFVDVIPPEEIKTTETIEPGSLLAGTRTAGIDDISREGTELIQELRKTVTSIDDVIKRVDTEILKKTNIEAIETTMQNFKKSSSNIEVSTAKLDAVIASAQSAVDTANSAMKTTDRAAEDLRLLLADARATVNAAKRVVDQVGQGEGVFGSIMSDRELANNLQAFLSNIRRHGVLFYRDSAGKLEEEKDELQMELSPPSRPAPPNRSRNPRR